MRPVSRRLSSAALVAGMIAVATAPRAAAEDNVKLTGCLLKGEGDAGYLLINVQEGPSVASAAGGTVKPSSVGTSGDYANVFYWLDKDDHLKSNVGRLVEIEGDRKDAIKDGEIKIDRKDQWTEIEVRSDGRKMKTQVPNASIVGGPDSDRKVDVLVRRVDVDKVRMLSATCR
jgi:hypothetical protein